MKHHHHWRFLRHNPLVGAAAFFLLGVALGRAHEGQVTAALWVAVASLVIWAATETILRGMSRLVAAHACLALAMIGAGAALWSLNQNHVPSMHVARLLEQDEPLPIAARLSVLTAPEGKSTHGNRTWVATVREVFTNRGWVPSTGDLRVKWRAGPHTPTLHRGDLVEVYGWLQLPETALNPGAIDMRRYLAADRIFAELRVPRATGVVLLAEGAHPGPAMLEKMRLFLRSKLLEHTARIDVEAAYSMVALLLGHRDPVIADVNAAFTDAGVAHLLAISGSHIVFFTGLIWALLRFIPLRPRWRESLVAAIMILYVLATPCGPPVVRAAVALLMVLAARLIGRPRMLMNMLAAAAIVVVLLRPADLFDAGFQLSFVSTAALILLAERFYTWFTGGATGWLERARMVADLSATTRARATFRAKQAFAGLLTANVIGALSAAPLVALHFGQVNLYGVLTGLIALPIVALTMAASALQLCLELIAGNLAVIPAILSTFMAQCMVWIVRQLAALPGAATAVRSPAAWLVFLMYAVFILWAARRWLKLPRALVINVTVAVLIVTLAWYAWAAPADELQITVLSVGQGSSVILQPPNNNPWLINAGSRDSPAMLDRAVAPALRLAGTKNLAALIITGFDTAASGAAGPVVARFHPALVLTSAQEWSRRGQTRSGAEVEDALSARGGAHVDLSAGATVNLGQQARLRVLWPPKTDPQANPALILLCEYAERRLLLVDPATVDILPLLAINNIDFRCDAIIFLGPERGAADTTLRKIIATTNARTLIWSGRTAWASKLSKENEWNSVDGAVKIRIDNRGQLSIHR